MFVKNNSSCPVCTGAYKLEHRDLDFSNLCPKHKSMFSVSKELSSDIDGFSPTPFVGRYGYPRVNVGLLTTSSERPRDEFDNPNLWARQDFGLQSLVDLRSSLVNSRFKATVDEARKTSKFLDISQEVGMAKEPVDVEVKLEEKPQFRINFGSYSAPTGPSASLIKADITSNPKIDSKVDKVFSDTDLKATGAIGYLSNSGIDENQLSRMLSIGAFGLKKDRKLVPTRWSITAVDDTLGKEMIGKLTGYPEHDLGAYFGGYLGNYYLILVFPGIWSYELFEMVVPNTMNYMTDYENYAGRKKYAFDTAGGYYTVRLAIAEKLNRIKRRGSVLALRFITDEYKVPLGVWVTREASRKTMAGKPVTFGSDDLILEYAKRFVKDKFGMELGYILRRSKLLNERKSQKRLSEFI